MIPFSRFSSQLLLLIFLAALDDAVSFWTSPGLWNCGVGVGPPTLLRSSGSCVLVVTALEASGDLAPISHH